MPIYVYKCPECGADQEHIHGLNEPAPPCEVCGHEPLKKQVTAAAFRLEPGVGWDGWDYMGPGTVGRTVDASKHIEDPVPQRLPGSRKVS